MTVRSRELVRATRATRVAAAAIDVGSLFDRFTRGAAIFSFRDLARTTRMRAFLGICHDFSPLATRLAF
jgi:hypothetical protein